MLVRKSWCQACIAFIAPGQRRPSRLQSFVEVYSKSSVPRHPCQQTGLQLSRVPETTQPSNPGACKKQSPLVELVSVLAKVPTQHASGVQARTKRDRCCVLKRKSPNMSGFLESLLATLDRFCRLEDPLLLTLVASDGSFR